MHPRCLTALAPEGVPLQGGLPLPGLLQLVRQRQPRAVIDPAAPVGFLRQTTPSAKMRASQDAKMRAMTHVTRHNHDRHVRCIHC